MDETFEHYLSQAQSILSQIKDTFDIVLIAHVREPRGKVNPIQLQCELTEFFTMEEFNEIYHGIVNSGFFIRSIYFNEIDLLEDVLLNQAKYKKSIIYNLSRNGLGVNKKTLVPSFCDMLGIPYTSSNSLVCALSRNKYYFSKLLEVHGIKTPRTWGYLGNDRWICNECPPEGLKVIIKPMCDSASQGISENSIIDFSADQIENIQDIFKQFFSKELVVQEFISGYECEVPIFEALPNIQVLEPVGISIGDQKCSNNILTYDLSYDNEYDFYTLESIFTKDVITFIKYQAQKTFELVGLEVYGRVDFRITDSGDAYVIDISTTPYTTKHSSFAFAFSNMQMPYEDIYNAILYGTQQKRMHHYNDRN